MKPGRKVSDRKAIEEMVRKFEEHVTKTNEILSRYADEISYATEAANVATDQAAALAMRLEETEAVLRLAQAQTHGLREAVQVLAVLTHTDTPEKARAVRDEILLLRSGDAGAMGRYRERSAPALEILQEGLAVVEEAAVAQVLTEDAARRAADATAAQGAEEASNLPSDAEAIPMPTISRTPTPEEEAAAPKIAATDRERMEALAVIEEAERLGRDPREVARARAHGRSGRSTLL